MEGLHEYRREDVERFPVEQFCQLLSYLHYSTELLQNVRKNAVTGDVFLQLSDEQLKEIAPKLGDRVQLKKLQTELLREAYEKVSWRLACTVFAYNSCLEPHLSCCIYQGEDEILPPHIYTSLHCHCGCVEEHKYDQLYGTIWSLVLCLLFAPIALPWAVMAVDYAYKV